MPQDRLMRAAKNANLSGSARTSFAHRQEASRFVDTLRELGYGVQKWQNVTNAHVAAVAERWTRGDENGEGKLAVATVKEYLSGVRAVAASYGNDGIREKNDFRDANGEQIVGARVYVTNETKGVSEEKYQAALARLESGEQGENGLRLAAQMRVMHDCGLRHEEARKMNPGESLRTGDGLDIFRGTKGGLRREHDELTPAGREAVEGLRPFIGAHGNSMPDGMSERQWERLAYRIAANVGISRAEAGASFHGLRHEWAQDRYEKLAGFPCPCRGGTPEQAREAAGEDWRVVDREARLTLKFEMGHGPDRDSVVSGYIGSW